jgi:hypothetical protein
MADNRVSPQPANLPIESPFVHPALYRPHEHVQPERRVAVRLSERNHDRRSLMTRSLDPFCGRQV